MHDADLVHFRFMTIILKDVPTVLRSAYLCAFFYPISRLSMLTVSA